MSPKIAVIGWMLLAMAACAPLPNSVPPHAPPPAAGPEAAAAPPSSPNAGAPSDLQEPDMQAMPPTDVRTMKCSVINSAGDDDKAYASTFLLGYRSALAHMHVIDTKRIDAILQAAVGQCAAKPDALAYKVFADAEIKVYAADHPPRRLLHKKLATTPAATSPETAAPAMEPGPSPETPPMRYAPAAGAPPPAEPPPASGDIPSSSSPSEGPPK
jgi:hypothetical protein